MPTGYTQAVYSGDTDFTKFVTNAARAFIPHMRDSNSNVRLQLVEDDNPYWSKSGRIKRCEQDLNTEKSKLSKITLMTDQEIQEVIDNKNKQELEHFEARKQERDQELDNYNSVLRQVVAWEPPTSNHVKLKEFMIEQLESSIEFDCSDSEPYLITYTVSEYRDDLILISTRMINHYQESLDKAKNAIDPNEWILELADSLPNGRKYVQ